MGLTNSEDALRPVQRIERSAGASGGRLIDYALERANTSVAEHIAEECAHIQKGHQLHDDYIWNSISMVIDALTVPDWPLERCIIDAQAADYAVTALGSLGCELEGALGMFRGPPQRGIRPRPSFCRGKAGRLRLGILRTQ